MTLEVAKMLVLSTAHLPGPITAENALDVTWYEKGEYGWLVNTFKFREPEDTMPELVAVLEFARAHDCTWVMFDRDGYTIDELPTFDW